MLGCFYHYTRALAEKLKKMDLYNKKNELVSRNYLIFMHLIKIVSPMCSLNILINKLNLEIILKNIGKNFF